MARWQNSLLSREVFQCLSGRAKAILVSIFLAAPLAGHAAFGLRISFPASGEWHKYTGLDQIIIKFNDVNEFSFQVDNNDRPFITLAKPIPPMVLLGISGRSATIQYMVSQDGKLEMQEYLSWNIAPFDSPRIVAILYEAPGGEYVGRAFSKSRESTAEQKGLLDKIKPITPPPDNIITHALKDALDTAKSLTLKGYPDNVNWLQFSGLNPHFKLSTSNHSATSVFTTHSTQKTQTKPEADIEKTITPPADPQIPAEDSIQKLPKEMLSNVMQASLLGNYAGDGSLAPAPSLSGSLAPPMEALSLQELIDDTGCPKIPPLSQDKQDQYPGLPDLVNKVNTADTASRLNAQRIDIGKTNLHLRRMDLMRHRLSKGITGLLEAKYAGAESIVYRGVYYLNGTHELVAVNQMFRSVTDTELERKRQRLLEYYPGQVDHPHLMQVKDWIATEQYILTVETMGIPLDKSKPWKERDLYVFAYQMLSAISALHQRQYVHRDFKPANVVQVSRQGRTHYILTDYGTLRPVTSNLMTMSFAAGTPGYMDTPRTRLYLDRMYSKTQIDDLNGYEQDLLAYATSLFTLYLGSHPTHIMKKTSAGKTPLHEFCDQIEKLQQCSQIGLPSFQTSVKRFLAKLDTVQKAELPDWLTNLTFQIFQSLEYAGEDTANRILTKAFPGNEEGWTEFPSTPGQKPAFMLKKGCQTPGQLPVMHDEKMDGFPLPGSRWGKKQKKAHL